MDFSASSSSLHTSVSQASIDPPPYESILPPPPQYPRSRSLAEGQTWLPPGPSTVPRRASDSPATLLSRTNNTASPPHSPSSGSRPRNIGQALFPPFPGRTQPDSNLRGAPPSSAPRSRQPRNIGQALFPPVTGSSSRPNPEPRRPSLPKQRPPRNIGQALFPSPTRSAFESSTSSASVTATPSSRPPRNTGQALFSTPAQAARPVLVAPEAAVAAAAAVSANGTTTNEGLLVSSTSSTSPSSPRFHIPFLGDRERGRGRRASASANGMGTVNGVTQSVEQVQEDYLQDSEPPPYAP